MQSVFSWRTIRRSSCAVVLAAMSFTFFSDSAQAGSHVVPASIDSTGASDVTKELIDFIAGVPDGSTVNFPAGATYRIEGVFAIAGRHDLVLDFNGSRLISDTDGSSVEPYYPLRQHWPRHRAHLYISESSGIEVRDLVVRGPNELGGRGDGAWRVEFEAQHAIEVNLSSDVTIEGCDLSKIYGDGVYIGRRSEGVRVRDCEIHHNGRQGIAVTGAKDVLLEGNHLYEIRRTAFDLEPNGESWHLENIRIQNNRVGHARGNFVSGHGRGSVFTGIAIVGNEVYGEMEISLRAPDGTRRGSVEIRGNSSTTKFGSPHALITVDGYSDVTIVGNSAPLDGRSGGVAISVERACVVDIRNNSFTNVETEMVVTHATDCPNASPEPTPSPPSPGTSHSPTVPSIRIGTADLVERPES